MDYDFPRKDGVTVRDHAEQAGVELEHPEIPVIAEDVWDIFWRMNPRRGNNGFGLMPISYTELEAWARLRNVEFTDWDLDAFDKMDTAFLSSVRKLNAD